MTENEAKEVVKKLRNKAELFKNSGFAVDGIVKSFEDSANAIETLSEEIQQYRAIGTVEQLEWCKDASHWKELFKEKLEKYEAIGTVEELKHLKEYVDVINKLCSDYSAIGTVEEFKALKEKNEPEKPLFVPTDDTCLYQEYRCPSCNEWLADKFKPYRCKCGQKLDWAMKGEDMADNMLIDGLIKFCDEKSKNIKLKAEPQVFIEIKQALEELKAIKQWKSDVMEGFCKYDASSFEEIVVNARAKAIDDFLHNAETKICDRILQNQARLDFASGLSVANRILDEIAEQMKAGGIE